MSEELPTLTAKMRKFADGYLSGMSKVEAARYAGYKGAPGTLRNVGYETYARPQVKAYIQERMEEWSIPASEVIYRISEIATGNVADYLDEYGGIDIEKVKAAGGLIKKLKTKETLAGIVEAEIELYPADDALKQLSKHYGLEKNNVQLTGKDGSALIFKVEYAD